MIPDLQGNWMVISGINSDNTTAAPYYMSSGFDVAKDTTVFDYTDRISGYLLDGFNWNATGYYTDMIFNCYSEAATTEPNGPRTYEIDFQIDGNIVNSAYLDIDLNGIDGFMSFGDGDANGFGVYNVVYNTATNDASTGY